MEENSNGSIVNTKEPYYYNKLIYNIHELLSHHTFIQSIIIGNSVLGKTIPCIKIGKGSNVVLYHGGIHANEWITSLLMMKFIENFCIAYEENNNLHGFNVRDLYNKTTLFIVPMVNPDGIDLVTGNVPENSEIFSNYMQIARNFPNIPFPSGWKANFNGVDLKNFQPIYLEYDVVKFSMFLGIPTILQEISIKIFSQFSSKIFQIFLTKSPFTFETFQILTTFIF